MSLFRKDALAAQRTLGLGDIVLIRPISFAIVTLVLAGFALLVCLFLVFGSYTKRTTVSGQIAPDTGLVKLYMPEAGIVLERKVVESQVVKAGDVLYVVSGERQSTLGDTQEAISVQIRQREQSLKSAREKTLLLHKSEHRELEMAIAGLKGQLETLNAQIAGQRGRVKLAEDSMQRYRGLTSKGYLSHEESDQKQAEWLDQRNQLQSLTRDHLRIGMDLSSRQSALSEQALRQQNQLAQIDRDLAGVAVDLNQSEAKRRMVITAPQSGVVTAVMAEVGQAVDTRRPLATIVPEGAHLQAELYAPSKAIGFVKRGDRVLIRLAAYPYQTYGQQAGVVETVTRTSVPEWQLNDGVSGKADDEGMYRIIVSLTEPTLGLPGQPLTLRPGMRLDADLFQQKRQLYQWAFEPANRLVEKL